ncbi:MAG: PA domain-containing protein, partial [Candidatus Eisenbacteria bacterium]
TIVNNDGVGEGVNSTTPVSPVGGNPGTTLGAQRLFVFQTAASIWGALLPSTVEIRVNAQFNPQTCDATSAVLGSAGAATNISGFAGAEVANTWYPIALANRMAGVDLAVGTNDINAQFNSTLDNGTCLGGTTWYYGVDGNEGSLIELLPVVLHELGHGLGFISTTSLATGALLSNRPNIYERNLLDRSLGVAGTAWPAMTNMQRVAAAVNTNNLVWTGSAVKTVAPTMLGPRVDLVITAPAAIAGSKTFGTAQFGPPASEANISGEIVLVDDEVAPVEDACEGIVNGAAVSGKIALIDRGLCPFVDKAANAAAAGAIAVLIANNVAGAPPAMGGDLPGLLIPVVSISQADGDAIKAQLAGGPVTMTLGPNPAFFAGADDDGRLRLFAPNPSQPGSSVSHWDTSAEPSLLMEPFITDSLTNDVDLTQFAFEDIGWFSPRTTDSPGDAMPLRLALATGRPNPFAGRTSIAFELPRAGRAALVVYDVSGRTIKHLLDAEMPAGRHAVTWDATDDRGGKVTPGVYFYRLKSGGAEGSKSVIYVTPDGR